MKGFQMSRPFKLFHFDIATENNFGDTLLFPAVKHVFEAYGAGEAFDIYDSRPLRENVGPALIRYINETADAVLVGGGGLFLSDTNPNEESGWQWRISMEMLDRLEVPIIVFAVGYNRFYGQPEFKAPFAEHLAKTMEKSIFFGLRNSGSIEKVSSYVRRELAEQIVYQPCPTTITRSVLPWEFEQPDDKRIGIQLSHGQREEASGFTRDGVINAADEVITELENSGWEIVLTPFTEFDEKFSRRLGNRFERHRLLPVYGSGVLDRGLSGLSRIPAVLGCRGHAQMIPFGLGSMPFSFDVHPKLGFFHSDIERSDWKADPRDSGFAQRMASTVEGAWENRDEHRAHLQTKQDEFLDLTRTNLESIYSALGGRPDSLEKPWKAYDTQGINVARSRFILEIQRENSIHRSHASDRQLRTVDRELREVEAQLVRARRDNYTASADRNILEAEVLRAQQAALALAERVARVEAENSSLRSVVQSTSERPPEARARDIVKSTVDRVVRKTKRTGEKNS